ncbi:MAG: Ig-like domain-containing protein, partial [Mariprofundales bacterium]|nr:Ig-like domain-containing protein [Mariprofundales bacterium]
ASDTLTVTVQDAYGQPVYNTPVTFSQTGAGSVNIYAAATNTDVQGKVTATISSATTGSVTITVTAAGTTASQSYSVSTGTVLAITSPTADPYALTAGVSLPITVTVPAGVTSVTFAASIGVWNGGTNSVVTVAVGAGKAIANLSSTQAGVSTIQVYDTANIGSTDSLTVTITQPAANAKTLMLQTNVSVVAPSTGTVSHTTTLTATVYDAGNQVVGGAGVLFSIAQGVGGGEKINKPIALLTNSVGQATATFTSGSVSTGARGIDVYATVIGSAPAIRGTTVIVIGGQAASLSIGRSNLIDTLSSTEYSLPMSVMVADGNGNPAANATVSLSAFPKKFLTGKWVNGDPDPTVKKFFTCITGTFSQEDANKNGVMDVGEDVVHVTGGSGCDVYGNLTGGAQTLAVNSKLDPPSAAAGIVPATVTTDSNGVANFNITYLKANAPWIETEVIASTQVVGSETKSSMAFVIPYLVTDGQSGFLPDPTFGQ